MKLLRSIALLAICLSLVLTTVFAAPEASPSPSPSPSASAETITDEQAAALMEKMLLVSEMIYETGLYSGGKDDPIYNALFDLMKNNPAFFDAFMEAMVSHYDQYSYYIPTGMHDLAYPSGQGYVGIGIAIDATRKGGLFIGSVMEDSPAAKAGLLPGDQIVSCDSKNVEFSSLDDFGLLVRGEADTTVILGVRRDGEILSFPMSRGPIYVSDVSYEKLADGVGYMTLDMFGSTNTFIDFLDIYFTIPYDDDIRSVIVDLRGNSGGGASVLNALLDYIVVEKDALLYTVKFQGDEKTEVKSSGLGFWKPNKMIILIDEDTASAAEIFAGTLSDLGYAETVGAQSYGKGYGQTHNVFEDDSAAVVTSSEVYLPETGAYSGKGLTPKYPVALETAPYPMPDLLPMYMYANINAESGGETVMALEQRLHELGYHGNEPDEVFDANTLWAINAVQRASKLKIGESADPAMLKVVEAEIAKLKESKIMVDSQLARALELAAAAAKEPLKFPLPEVNPLLEK